MKLEIRTFQIEHKGVQQLWLRMESHRTVLEFATSVEGLQRLHTQIGISLESARAGFMVQATDVGEV